MDHDPLGPTAAIAQRVRELRTKRGWSAERLAQEMRGAGVGWNRGVVAKLESGRRQDVSVAELLALSFVLNVAPVHLVVSPTAVDASYQVTPQLTVAAEAVREWIRGYAFLPGTDRQLYFAEVSPDEFQEIAGIRFPPTVQQRLRRHATGAPPLQPVVAAVVTSDLGVLAGRRNYGEPGWTFISGEPDPGERPEDTATRIVMEETGLRIQAGQLIGEGVHPQSRRTTIYVAATPTRGTDVSAGDSEELAEVRWVSVAEADELLPGMFEAVREHLARELGGSSS